MHLLYLLDCAMRTTTPAIPHPCRSLPVWRSALPKSGLAGWVSGWFLQGACSEQFALVGLSSAWRHNSYWFEASEFFFTDCRDRPTYRYSEPRFWWLGEPPRLWPSGCRSHWDARYRTWASRWSEPPTNLSTISMLLTRLLCIGYPNFWPRATRILHRYRQNRKMRSMLARKWWPVDTNHRACWPLQERKS